MEEVPTCPSQHCPVSGKWPLLLFWSSKPVFPLSCLLVIHMVSPAACTTSGVTSGEVGWWATAFLTQTSCAVGPFGPPESQGPDRGLSTSNAAPGHPVSPLGPWLKLFFQDGSWWRIPVGLSLGLQFPPALIPCEAALVPSTGPFRFGLSRAILGSILRPLS